MNQITTQSPKEQRLQALAQDRKRILGLPPEKALEAIADHPYPVTLVQSMAEEDLYFLVHHIGPEDAVPVLALASNQQWDYLLDLEGWDRDQVSPLATTEWLVRLLKADADRFTHWIIHEKQDELAFYLFRNIELHIREYDQDPGEVADDFFTEDQTYYMRLRPYPALQEKGQESRDLFVKDLLNRIAVYDYSRYRDFLLASQSVIPSETEEELYRQRNVRLAEKGLLPFDEAVGVYQPLKPIELHARGRKTAAFDGRIVDAYPLPVDSQGPSEDADLFSRTLLQIQDPHALHRLQAEFAGLCNQVIAADQKRIREKAILTQVVRKVGGYLSIGLEKVAAESQTDTPYANANLIQYHLLADIFRVGYGCALALKWRAEKWQRASWYHHAGLPLSFWGEVFTGVLGGLLIKKPLYYDNYATGVLYREFATLEDIEKTTAQLDRIIAFDDLFSLMGVEIGSVRGDGPLTYENALLTLWANHSLNMGTAPNTPLPLRRDQFSRFFDELWRPDIRPRRISNTVREIFLGWIADRSGLTTYEISERMASALEQLFLNLEEELGDVERKDLDSRFISLFLFTTP